MNWHTVAASLAERGRGSEGGEIIRDEELLGAARITAERGGRTAPFAITCGIYGWMVHTRFFGSDVEALSEYEKMKEALAAVVESIPFADEVLSQ